MLGYCGHFHRQSGKMLINGMICMKTHSDWMSVEIEKKIVDVVNLIRACQRGSDS